MWHDDFARIDRACQRFLQVGGSGQPWAEVLGLIEEARSEAWRRCLGAAALDPRAAAEVPGNVRLAALHRALSRAAVRCAQAAEAVVMADPQEPDTAAAVRAATQAVSALRALETVDIRSRDSPGGLR